MPRASATVERPAGFRYHEDFVTGAEERTLVEQIEHLSFEEVQFRGVVAKRVVRHFGYGYDFTSHAVEPIEPIPGWLIPLRARAAAAVERAPDDFAEALVIRYPPGAGIGWHRDAPAFGSVVIGISLGAPCRMRFQRTVKGERAVFDQPLAPRSMYVLGGAARASWQHSIPAVTATRYSITFRTLRARRDA